MFEPVIGACHSIQFTIEGLQDALKTATAVQSLILMPMISQAVALSENIKALMIALDCDAMAATAA